MAEIRAMVAQGAVIPLPQDLFPADVCDKGVPACNRPSFQDGDLVSHHQGSVSQRLVSVARPDSHAFSHAHQSKALAFSTLCSV